MEINNDARAVREHLNGKKHREGLERLRLSKNNLMAMFKKKSAPQAPEDVPSSSSAITATSASSSSSAATGQVSQPSAAPESKANPHSPQQALEPTATNSNSGPAVTEQVSQSSASSAPQATPRSAQSSQATPKAARRSQSAPPRGPATPTAPSTSESQEKRAPPKWEEIHDAVRVVAHLGEDSRAHYNVAQGYAKAIKNYHPDVLWALVDASKRTPPEVPPPPGQWPFEAKRVLVVQQDGGTTTLKEVWMMCEMHTALAMAQRMEANGHFFGQ